MTVSEKIVYIESWRGMGTADDICLFYIQEALDSASTPSEAVRKVRGLLNARVEGRVKRMADFDVEVGE